MSRHRRSLRTTGTLCLNRSRLPALVAVRGHEHRDIQGKRWKIVMPVGLSTGTGSQCSRVPRPTKAVQTHTKRPPCRGPPVMQRAQLQVAWPQSSLKDLTSGCWKH